MLMPYVRTVKRVDRGAVLAELNALDLPAAEYVVVGGAVLAVWDLRDTEDIDLVVTQRLFDQLAARGWQRKLRPDGNPSLKARHTKAYLDVSCEAFARSTSWLLEHAELIH